MPKFANVDAYIAAQSADVQPRLREFRAVIRAALPDATEVIAYDIPTYRFSGGGMVSFGAAKRHAALYGAPIDLFPDAVAAYSTSRGTLRFPLDRPIPEDLVRTLVQAKAAGRSS